MALPLFPVSPLPANLNRTFDWGENVVTYDTGDQQADTSWTKPLYKYDIPIPYYNEFQQSSLWAFYMDRRGMVKPFLMKDPYDFAVNSVMAVRSGITNAATLYMFDTNSFRIRPDSLTVGSLFSSLSGYVRLGVEYNLDQDSGLLTVNTKATADVWGARSIQYFKKCRFVQKYTENSKLWNIFNAQLTIQEMP